MPLVAHKNGESLWVSNQSQNRTKKLILWAVFVYKTCAGIFTYFHLGLWRLHPSTIKHKPGCLFFFFSFKPQHTFSWIRKQFPDTMKMDACLMMVTNVRCSAVPGHCDSNASTVSPLCSILGPRFFPWGDKCHETRSEAIPQMLTEKQALLYASWAEGPSCTPDITAHQFTWATGAVLTTKLPRILGGITWQK